MKLLSSYASKTSVRNAVHNIAAPLTRGFFRDNDWSNVRTVFDAIRNAGADVQILSGTYFHFPASHCRANMIAGKEYAIEVTCGKFVLRGKLICSFADDANAVYDMALCLS